ncbi:hypothetical protein ACLOJK_000947 [Asimina triloba]
MEEEIAGEQVRVRGRLETSNKHPLEGSTEGDPTPKNDASLKVLEESRKTFQVEEEIRKAEELQLRVTVALSREEPLQVGMKVSLAKGLRVAIVEADVSKMLEVEDALLPWAIIPGATGLLRLKATLEVCGEVAAPGYPLIPADEAFLVFRGEFQTKVISIEGGVDGNMTERRLAIMSVLPSLQKELLLGGIAEGVDENVT